MVTLEIMRVNSKRKRIWIIAANKRNQSPGSVRQGLTTHWFAVATQNKIALFVENRGLIDRGMSVIHIHQIQQPHNLFVAVVHRGGRHEEEPRTIHLLNQLHQVHRNTLILIVITQTNIVDFVNHYESVLKCPF